MPRAYFLIVCVVIAVPATAAPPIHIGDRLELMIDKYLVDQTKGTKLKLHKPIPREVAIDHNTPWEGNTCGYHTVIRDGDKYRLWYRGTHYDLANRRPRIPYEVACYAESKDGIHWSRPNLGLVEFGGSKKNNIFWTERMTKHAPGQKPAKMPLIPFIDRRPQRPESARFKAVAGAMRAGLYGWTSNDGIHWHQIGDRTIFRDPTHIDWTQSAFWDPNRRRYVAYLRDWWPNGIGGDGTGNFRAFRFITSKDFRSWSQPKRIQLNLQPTRREQYYTNQIRLYDRAPHIYLGFPTRHTQGRSDDSTNDALFMTSRDGVRFRLWREAIIRPGLQLQRWMTRNNMMALGVVQTKSDSTGIDELSIYAAEGTFGGPQGKGASNRLRRYTYRMDGFVSLSAPPSGGEFLTKPLVFRGDELVLNFSTSGAGSMRVEIQDEKGKPLPGFTLSDSPTVYGDSIEYVMRWKRKGRKGLNTRVTQLAGRPIRLRVVMKEADLYSFRFRTHDPKRKQRYTGFAMPGTKVIRK